MRSRVCYSFFRDEFYEQNKLQQRKRRTWNGLYIYAVDGIQFTLPRSQDIVEADYSGRKVSKYRESYMPKMFATMALDVINGTIKDIRENATLNEIADANEMVPSFEDNSLTIYDRLFACRKLIHIHNDNQSFFLFRLRKSVMSELKPIFKSRKSSLTVEVDGIKIHLIKTRNPKTKERLYFATNLPSKMVTSKSMQKLYILRWEVENAFRDFVQTIRLEQWHSKSINGIRQELYVALWMYNFVKMKILSRFNPAKTCMQAAYKKPNFKLIFGWITSKLYEIFKQSRGVLKDLTEIVRRNIEVRKRYSRSYPRELRSPASPFPYNNTRWNL